MYIPNNYFGKSLEAKASTSYDNNDYVIWAAFGLLFGRKQLTRFSCQRLQNVSLSIRWENVGKKAQERAAGFKNGELFSDRGKFTRFHNQESAWRKERSCQLVWLNNNRTSQRCFAAVRTAGVFIFTMLGAS